jgi:transposase
MQNKSSKLLDFSGHNVYVGLDVHAKSWAVNILVDEITHRKFIQPPDPVILHNYLVKHFPGANYYSAYECGFCGFHHHRKLTELGVKNIVINAADLPATNKERVNKMDPIDSRRLSHALKNNQIHGIYVFSPEAEQFRSLFRMRWRAAKEHRRVKNRICSFLYYYGVNSPADLKPEYWPRVYINWLEHLVLPNKAGTMALSYLLKAYHSTRKQVLEVTRELRNEIKENHHKVYKLLQTVPGVGPLTAMCLIAEIGDIFRFKSCRQLTSYVGLVPHSHQSGDKDPAGRLTYRSNKYLRASIVEAAWVAMRHDPALLKYYKEHIVRHKPQVAIIKVAHKLLNRVRYVWLNQEEYQMSFG